MKVAIYGVSASGKDFLIEKVVKAFNCENANRAIHLKGSTILKSLAKEHFGQDFKVLSDQEKNTLRALFCNLVSETARTYDFVFVDGHYSFIEQEGFDVTFTQKDEALYDAFFYLDTPSEMIVKFSRTREFAKRDQSITAASIHRWKAFEKANLAKICNSLDKELIILDEDTETVITFLKAYLSPETRGYYDPKNAASFLVNQVPKDLLNYDKILIADCDKTLSENDVTFYFCDHLDIPTSQVKQIFRNDRYTSYQFFKLSKLYATKSPVDLSNAAIIAQKKLIISRSTIAYIHRKYCGFYKIALTSGLKSVWSLVATNEQFHALLASQSPSGLTGFVTPLVKKEIVLALQRMGKTVVAIGDSMIDIPMLEIADQAYIVAHQKLSSAVVNYFEKNGGTNIRQISFSSNKYKNIETVEDLK